MMAILIKQLIFIKKNMNKKIKKNNFLVFFIEALKLYRVWSFTAWTRTEERFIRTSLGSIWLGLSNLISIALLSVVYGAVFKVENFRNYLLYIGLGLVLWSTISTSISSSPNILIQNEIKIKNTNLNILFYPLEEWCFQLHNFFQSFSIVFIALIFVNKSIFINFFLYSTLPLINFFIFMFWFPFFLCLLGVRYRDVYQLVPIILQLTFLLSPILYIKENLGKLIWIVNLNPVYIIISQLRDSIIGSEINNINFFYTFLMNLLGLIVSLLYFRKLKNHIPFLL